MASERPEVRNWVRRVDERLDQIEQNLEALNKLVADVLIRQFTEDHEAAQRDDKGGRDA